MCLYWDPDWTKEMNTVEKISKLKHETISIKAAFQRSSSPHYSQSEAKLTSHCTEVAAVGVQNCFMDRFTLRTTKLWLAARKSVTTTSKNVPLPSNP